MESHGSVVSLVLYLGLLLLLSCQSGISQEGQPLTTPQDAIDETVRLLNFYRGNVTPTAANMHRLVSSSYLNIYSEQDH